MQKRPQLGRRDARVRRNKYGNHRVTAADGTKFDSKREFTRWQELNLMQKASEISGLRVQVRFPLKCNGKPLLYKSGRQVVYVADFVYVDRRHPTVVIEDCKGMRTDVYKLKRAIMRANGYEILET